MKKPRDCIGAGLNLGDLPQLLVIRIMRIILDWVQTQNEQLMGYPHLTTNDLIDIQVNLEPFARFARHWSALYHPYLARGGDATEGSVYRDHAILMSPQPTGDRLQESQFVIAWDNLRPPGFPYWYDDEGICVTRWCWQLDRSIARRLMNITTVLRTCRIIVSSRQAMSLSIMENDFYFLHVDYLDPLGPMEGIQRRQEYHECLTDSESDHESV